MKCHLQVLATVVLAVVVSFPSVAGAEPRDRGREKGPIVRIVLKIRNFFGVTTHSDLPTPPTPNNPKP